MLRHRLRRAGLLLLAGLSIALSAGHRAEAQGTWPERPIRLIVPFAPGGVTDGIARLSADWLSKTLGQPVPVENRSGANGAIAAEFVARSAPDGYTLFMASASQMVMLPALMQLNFDPVKDFAPVSIVASNPVVFAASTKLGVRTLPEFLDLARRQPGKFDYSSAGTGSSSHLAMALFLSRAGIEMQHVPYRGGAPATQALLTGDVAAHFGNPTDVIPHQGGGSIRLLAIAGPDRLPSLRDVPTFDEAGFPGFRAETWNGIVAPAGTPMAVVQRVAEALGHACQDAEFRASLERLGTTPICGKPADFLGAIQADGALWREAVRISGARLD
ncbi:Bug family tripartite tricarboxylate transporter substrate binding protein [Roseomonas chloroacetimidivorans]|uniref:Bug family tripartite tricarboxylate transporter substrate binding protein n=1 Tax=Roseomonas chloroacetimidivorans TaxID=1766656 RepID=UPI003C710AD7